MKCRVVVCYANLLRDSDEMEFAGAGDGGRNGGMAGQGI